jgi:DNA polymerase V
MPPLVFALVDCNNFYASCERVFQPRLEGKPVLVLSNNDGCVIARSNETKALGIKMGEPYHLVKDAVRQHGITVFSSNYTLYGHMSRRVMDTLAQFTPEIENYSIDESFLNLAGFERQGIEAYAHTIRKTVRRCTGIPVSVGLGATKTLAKIANRLAKKNPAAGGVYDLTGTTSIDDALATVAVGDIWGVGHQSSEWLTDQGIETALDLKRAPPKHIRSHMHVVGERIQQELNGESCLSLELVAPTRKGITVSRSFGRYLVSLDDVREMLMAHVMRAGEKLRRHGLMAAHLSVFLQTNRFSKVHPFYAKTLSLQLPFATDYTPELAHYAMLLLGKLYRPGFHYNKCGLMLVELQNATLDRQDLFDERDPAKQAKLMKAMDSINTLYGARSVAFASMKHKQTGAMTRDRLSPHFTTDWKQLPKVMANERLQP